MLFNSFAYAYFFVAITIVSFATPARWRWLPLLIGSYYFYSCANPVYLLLILASTLVDYFVSMAMWRSASESGKRFLLSVSLFANLGLLFAFKYYNFFADNVAQVTDALGMAWHPSRSQLPLPVGISFYTFQTLSYTIDVYRGRLKPETHLGRFALYVAFFPQLVAGPIERAVNLLPQLNSEQHFEVKRLISGLRLILWGLFKKVVIADRLSDFVTRVYDAPDHFSGPTLWLATYFFAFQIYCDFSAYSDIAIGSARVLGIDLMQNFNLPYMATSIADFWRRWHISLSTWFRDYVYFPLGGNRIDSQWLWARNVMVVFVVSGIWHGASWTYFVWGVLHGLYLVLGAWTRPVRARLADRLRIPTKVLWCWQVFVTFHLVLVSWVFFRARTVTDACRILWTMMTDWTGQLYLGPSQLATILAAALVALLLIVQLGQIRGWLPFYRSARKHGWYVRWPAYVTLILLIAMLGVTANDFIYFQF